MIPEAERKNRNRVAVTIQATVLATSSTITRTCMMIPRHPDLGSGMFSAVHGVGVHVHVHYGVFGISIIAATPSSLLGVLGEGW